MVLEKSLCAICGISFDTCEECRQHSKTDAHIVNTDFQFGAVNLGHQPGATFSLPFRPKNESKECREPANPSCDGFSNPKSVLKSEAQGEETLEFHPESCLFCCHASSSFDENMAHMTTCHGFIILLTKDLPLKHIAVVKYLWHIIFENHECICCEEQYPTLESAQSHMRDKSHCCFQLTPDISGRIWWIEV